MHSFSAMSYGMAKLMSARSKEINTLKEMGVYVFRSRWASFIKVGHYSGKNVYSRIAHRGFHSCVCPDELEGRVNVEDVELMAWFPALTKKEEREVKSKWKEDRVYGKSEWFPSSRLEEIVAYLSERDSDQKDTCDLQEALQTRRRL